MRIQLAFIIISYFCIILLDLYIWNDFKKLSVFSFEAPLRKKRCVWDKIFIAFSIATIALLTVAICLPRRSESGELQTIMWLLYIFLTIFISELVYFIFSLIGFIPAVISRIRHAGNLYFGRLQRRRNTGFWIGLPLAVTVFAFMWWGALEGRRRIEVTQLEITSPRLPESFNGYRLIQISDLHVGTWGDDTRFLKSMVDSINSMHPDMIVFTGDIVNRDSKELIPFLRVLSELKAKDGVFSILGNHDYGDYIDWSNPEEKNLNLELLKQMHAKMGWQLLDNRSVGIKAANGDSIVIIGVGNVGEPPFKVYGDLAEAYPQTDWNDGNYKILLSHNPKHWSNEVSNKTNIDLTLSGHTHAMQIMLKIGDWRWSPAKWRYELWGGLYEHENNAGDKQNLYVNIGSGEVGLPMRIGATPEITLITLKK